MVVVAAAVLGVVDSAAGVVAIVGEVDSAAYVVVVVVATVSFC